MDPIRDEVYSERQTDQKTSDDDGGRHPDQDQGLADLRP